MTLVVPGLGSTPGEARLPAVGLRGTRVVVTLPGHGTAPDLPQEYWQYDRLAQDVGAVADEVGATRAIGVSLGVSALLRLVAERPDRFERLALLLPAVLDRPRSPTGPDPLRQLAEAAELASQDRSPLRELVAAGLPPRAELADYVEARVDALVRLRPALRALPDQVPLADLSPLAKVSAPAMVVTGTGDALHPEHVARALAAALPAATLEILDSAAPLITHRAEFRALLGDWARE